MKQIVIAMKGKHFNLPHIFWQQTRTFSETRLRDKEFRDPGYTPKTDTILNKRTPEGIYAGGVGVRMNYRYVEWKWKVKKCMQP